MGTYRENEDQHKGKCLSFSSLMYISCVMLCVYFSIDACFDLYDYTSCLPEKLKPTTYVLDICGENMFTE
jgi:hypothetical protein